MLINLRYGASRAGITTYVYFAVRHTRVFGVTSGHVNVNAMSTSLSEVYLSKAVSPFVPLAFHRAHAST